MLLIPEIPKINQNEYKYVHRLILISPYLRWQSETQADAFYLMVCSKIWGQQRDIQGNSKSYQQTYGMKSSYDYEQTT